MTIRPEIVQSPFTTVLHIDDMDRNELCGEYFEPRNKFAGVPGVTHPIFERSFFEDRLDTPRKRTTGGVEYIKTIDNRNIIEIIMKWKLWPLIAPYNTTMAMGTGRSIEYQKVPFTKG